MHLVTSIRLSVRLFAFLRLNHLTYGLHLLHGGRPSNFWHAAVDIRGSALLSASKGNECHYQSKVFVCGRMQYADNRADAVDQLLFAPYAFDN